VEAPLICSDTSAKLPAVKIGLPIDLAKDISYLLEGIKSLGGNGRITLDLSNGSVTSTEVTIKRSRKKSA
jgi:hypothetical protein